MASPQVLTQFLRAIVIAKRSLNLYPEGGRMAGVWMPRFRRALIDALDQGLTFPVNVGRDSFLWSGAEEPIPDPAIEALRFDFQSRGVVWFSIEREVDDGELRAFLDLLCLPPEQLSSVASAPAFLRNRGVVHITIGAVALGNALENDLGASRRFTGDLDTQSNSLLASLDEMEVFADAMKSSIEDYLKELTYDRSRLGEWFIEIFTKKGLDALFVGVRMLGATAENSIDREIRLRTILEAISRLPPTIFAPFIGDRLIPMAPYDVVAFNLLSQVTEAELRLIAQHVPQERLIALSSDLVEFSWESEKRQRLIEAVTWALQCSDDASRPANEIPLSADDPILAELREEIVSASQRGRLLDRSVDILLFLVFDDAVPDVRLVPFRALLEALAEALSLRMPSLCVSILRRVMSRVAEGPVPSELEEPIAEFKQLAADPTFVVLIAEPLCGNPKPEEIDAVVEYLSHVGEPGISAFTELLATEDDRRIRMRMCDVLTRVGPPAMPVLTERAADPRWFLARNALYMLGKMRHPEAVPAVTVALDYPHPRVRVEAIRAALLIDSPLSTSLILRRIDDSEPSVRRAAINAIGRKGNAESVPALRTLVVARVQAPVDWEIKSEAVDALATIGTPSARTVLQELANRRAWFWARAERRLRDQAGQALQRFVSAENVKQSELHAG